VPNRRDGCVVNVLNGNSNPVANLWSEAIQFACLEEAWYQCTERGGSVEPMQALKEAWKVLLPSRDMLPSLKPTLKIQRRVQSLETKARTGWLAAARGLERSPVAVDHHQHHHWLERSVIMNSLKNCSMGEPNAHRNISSTKNSNRLQPRLPERPVIDRVVRCCVTRGVCSLRLLLLPSFRLLLHLCC
jgi:hypothetical protein